MTRVCQIVGSLLLARIVLCFKILSGESDVQFGPLVCIKTRRRACDTTRYQDTHTWRH